MDKELCPTHQIHVSEYTNFGSFKKCWKCNWEQHIGNKNPPLGDKVGVVERKSPLYWLPKLTD